MACSPYSVTVFSFARFLPSFFNKLGCTAKITSICGERLQMQMFIYCGGFQMLMHIYCVELQMLMHIYCGELQMLMHIYCGGLQMLMQHLLWWIANSARRQAHGFCFIKRYLCVTLFQGPTTRTVIFLACCSDMNHRLAV